MLRLKEFWIFVFAIVVIVGSLWWTIHEAVQCAAVGGNYHAQTKYQHSQCEMSYKK